MILVAVVLSMVSPGQAADEETEAADARLFTVEEQPDRGWVVIRSERGPAP
jgi:hypothetical protein